ncbi:MAG: hypothetical protein V9G29_08415 [Burkholderiaceae bacterium]
MTKIDVARRQLVSAIRLLFEGGDLVSIYTLGANAWEVIDALCTKESVESASKQTRENIPSQSCLKRDYINSPYRNFFKHADKDYDTKLPEIPEHQVDAVLFLAVEDYLRLTQKAPLELQVFQLWYLAINTEKVAGDALEMILESIESTFPNIRSLPRQQRLWMARMALANAALDHDLLDDSRTEPAA